MFFDLALLVAILVAYGLLWRLWGVERARVRVLEDTNATLKQHRDEIILFYSDTVQANVMDDEPFYEMDLREIIDSDVRCLTSFRREHFDVKTALNEAEQMRYTQNIQRLIGQQEARADEMGHEVNDGCLDYGARAGENQGLCCEAEWPSRGHLHASRRRAGVHR